MDKVKLFFITYIISFLTFYLLADLSLTTLAYTSSCERIDRATAKEQMGQCLRQAACVWTRF